MSAGPRLASAGGVAFPAAAVVLLNWNGWQDTEKCLQSLAHLAHPCRVIVVDNGSSNGSAVRLAPLLPPPHRLLCNPANYGFARGCNAGLRCALAQGAEYVWLLNNDTCVEPGTLSALVAEAESDPRIGAVGGVLCDMDCPDNVHEWGGGSLSMRTGFHRVFRRAPNSGALGYVCGGCLLLRRAALDAVGLLDTGYFMYGEDVELGIRLRAAGWKLAVARGARVRHRRGPGLSTEAKMFYSSAGLALTLRKHSAWPLAATILGTARRGARPVLTGRLRQLRAVVGGAVAGWRAFGRGVPMCTDSPGGRLAWRIAPMPVSDEATD
jgi:GT2 family glycosyltransferase